MRTGRRVARGRGAWTGALALVGQLLACDACGSAAPSVESARGASERSVEGDTTEAPDEGALEGLAITPLGAAPLCEASALVRFPSAAFPSAADRYLVADNEDHDALTAFTLRDGRLVDPVRWDLPRRAPHDIEALAWDDAALVVVGSQSRRRDGSRVDARRRIVWVHASEGSLELDELRRLELPAVPADVATCVASWLAPEAGSEGRALCEALVAAETRGEGRLDVEGAFVRDGHLWLGLRAPLVDEDALLVRLTSEGRVDALRRLDLGARGVRELAVTSNALFVVGGSPSDGPAPHALFRAGLDEGPASLVRLLPNRTEGLAIDGDLALAVVDGDRGSSDAACATASTQARFTAR